MFACEDALAARGDAGLTEFVEDTFAVAFGDADACVSDIEDDEASFGACGDGDASAVGGEFDGV